MAGGSMRVPLHGPFYVGIGVCSHDKDAVEKAVFSNVDLAAVPPASGQPILHSAGTVPNSLQDRRVIYVAPEPPGISLVLRRRHSSSSSARAIRRAGTGGKWWRPRSTRWPPMPRPKASSSISNQTAPELYADMAHANRWQRTGAIHLRRFPELLSTRFAGRKTDGFSIVCEGCFRHSGSGCDAPADVARHCRETKVKLLARLVRGKGTIDAPSWSPDSLRLAFVSYQLVQ